MSAAATPVELAASVSRTVAFRHGEGGQQGENDVSGGQLFFVYGGIVEEFDGMFAVALKNLSSRMARVN